MKNIACLDDIFEIRVESLSLTRQDCVQYLNLVSSDLSNIW